MNNISAWSKINGDWKEQGYTGVRVGGQWKPISRSFVKVNGAWKTAGLGTPPPRPIMQWYAFGQFKITNYNSSFDYQTRFATGSGSASLNTSTGIYTLNGVNSGFYVSAAYAAGAPRSEEGYMERKARQQRCGNFSQCGTAPTYPCNCRENKRATCNEAPLVIQQPPLVDLDGNIIQPGGPDLYECNDPKCPCFDADQTRCICWVYGPPFCDQCGGGFNYCCIDVSFSGQGYTDRGSEWSKQS